MSERDPWLVEGEVEAAEEAAGRSKPVHLSTYSALTNDTFNPFAVYQGRAIGYALGTVLLGAVASMAGIWLSRRQLRVAPEGRDSA